MAIHMTAFAVAKQQSIVEGDRTMMWAGTGRGAAGHASLLHDSGAKAHCGGGGGGGARSSCCYHGGVLLGTCAVSRSCGAVSNENQQLGPDTSQQIEPE